jgi:prepilin-type N-terminal cleavage/methylation domain-containing protein
MASNNYREDCSPDSSVRSVRVAPRAFSLIELVIVMLIMSIFAAVAAPKFHNSLLFHRVESAARRLKADIDMARQRARLTSASQTVTFANSSYTVSGAQGLDRPSNTYTVSLLASPYSLDSGVANFGSGSQTLVFDGYGTPTSGGTVVLTASVHSCTVTVDSATGVTTFTSSHPGGGGASVNGG